MSSSDWLLCSVSYLVGLHQGSCGCMLHWVTYVELHSWSDKHFTQTYCIENYKFNLCHPVSYIHKVSFQVVDELLKFDEMTVCVLVHKDCVHIPLYIMLTMTRCSYMMSVIMAACSWDFTDNFLQSNVNPFFGVSVFQSFLIPFHSMKYVKFEF